MVILRYYTFDNWEVERMHKVFDQLREINADIDSLSMEKCFHIEIALDIALWNDKYDKALRWLLKQPQSVDHLKRQSALCLQSADRELLIEIGPRFNFCTAFSTNCLNICHNIGMKQITRLESSMRYLIGFKEKCPKDIVAKIIDYLSDRMTECCYTAENMPKKTFDERLPKSLTSWYFVPVLEQGRKALEEVNVKLGLAFGEWDLDYYNNLFTKVLKRNPTTVELFDCAQSNSEHSRHWFFRGKMIIDGEEKPKSLIRMIMDTQAHTYPNNTIKFSDNSSAITGFEHLQIRPQSFDGPDKVEICSTKSDLIFTAETHNMPTAVAPFSGATTGTGGRIRDVQGVGRGGRPIAGTAGYCVGCLNIPHYPQHHENNNFTYPASFAEPLKVLIDASNGASDYGNKFGEPVISGFVTSYGIMNAQGERDEYVKPIMFSGGLGTMDASMTAKINPQRGMLLAKIGGPVYRIGVGGGAASSVEIQGSNDTDLDFNAVQRGDAEMENKVNRVVRACIEMGEKNPILAIHDQGAGGNGNVLKELVEPGFAGAIIFSKEFQLGDPTITALELWGAEYQENNAILCKAEDRKMLERICERERCPINFVGIVTGDGRVSLVESEADFERALKTNDPTEFGPMPFDLHLEHVLGDMPKREYELESKLVKLLPLKFEPFFDYVESLARVLTLVTVGSKRFLTNKVDRCVTGLIVQQQCVGPLHTPVADYGLTLVSHFGTEGIATSIGTQPIKGLLDAAAMARMSVAEALSNLVFVKITDLSNVKCSGNWMWAAKLPGEGAKMFNACEEMCAIMKDLNIAVDGGKDSLSMAAKVSGDTVKSPGTLVISTYAPCPDVTLRITPDLKGPSMRKQTSLLWINIEGKFRLGASALAQVYMQQGNECPTLQRTKTLKNAFNKTQLLLAERKLLAGHDISDGGLLVCVLEMAFAGIAGVELDLTDVITEIDLNNVDKSAVSMPEFAILFAEECGWVVEVEDSILAEVQNEYMCAKVPTYIIGKTTQYGLDADVCVKSKGNVLLQNSVRNLCKQWECTSYQLEKLQADASCVTEEYRSLTYRRGPTYSCSVDLAAELKLKRSGSIVRVAVLREEGVNSDREMMACLLKANFEVHDVTMSDLLSGKTTLSNYRGLVFPGGFSYADTLGSAKGWAGNIMFSDVLKPQFRAFKEREDVFSLGVCNGCQLMTLIGWVGDVERHLYTNDDTDISDVALMHNKSERFECRWSSLLINKQTKSIMLRKLAGSTLGCWVAHGEGQFVFRNLNILDVLVNTGAVAMYYVDDDGRPTESYPMNPNGSSNGIAGLCSEDGRHLAIMPHPERCSDMHLWPYVPPNFNVATKESPWQLMFNNAYDWCQEETERDE